MKMRRWATGSATYVFLIALLIIMIYPLVWMFMATFKTNEEIFRSVALFPQSWSLDAFINGWQGNRQITYSTFFLNSFKLVIPTVLATVVSSSLVAYGFARFRFRLKRVLFSLVIGALLLPHEVLIVPQYLIFRNLGWIDSYWPFIVPAALACYPFFIFMLVQFFRGFPRELEEAAIIDGCGSMGIFLRIIVPLSKPALISVALFQFVWRWNDFLNSLIYINTTSKFTVPLALRMSLDISGMVNWNSLLAMSLLAICPLIIVFIFSQKYFVEGIVTTGIKG